MKDGRKDICPRASAQPFDEQLRQMGLRSTRWSLPKADHHGNLFRQETRPQSAELLRDSYIESLEMAPARASEPLLRIRITVLKQQNPCFGRKQRHGKSTFLRSLAGLEKRAKGYVRYNDKRYKLRHFRPFCSVVFQDVNRQLLTGSAYEELLLSLEDSYLQAEEKKERIFSLAKQLELYDLLDAHPFSLSGGQKQRLAVAATLLMDRPSLILDEPTSGLDLKHMVAMAEVLSEYSRSHLILLATHDQELLRLLDAEIHELVDPAQVKLCEN